MKPTTSPTAAITQLPLSTLTKHRPIYWWYLVATKTARLKRYLFGNFLLPLAPFGRGGATSALQALQAAGKCGLATLNIFLAPDDLVPFYRHLLST